MNDNGRRVPVTRESLPDLIRQASMKTETVEGKRLAQLMQMGMYLPLAPGLLATAEAQGLKPHRATRSHVKPNAAARRKARWDAKRGADQCTS